MCMTDIFCKKKQVLFVLIAALGYIVILIPWDISEYNCQPQDGSDFTVTGINTPRKDPRDDLSNRSNSLQDLKQKHPHNESSRSSNSSHRLAVIVPFRDCFEELQQFVPHMHKFLLTKNIKHKIFIINQADLFRFNRAALINIGFLESESECDYIAMHDIDLLPLNPDLNYGFPSTGVFHVSAPGLHPNYQYRKFIGGILIFSNKNFKQINGMSTKYWGWGREDDDLYKRIEGAHFTIQRPKGLTTGMNKTFLDIHVPRKRHRDKFKTPQQAKDRYITEKVTGIDSIKYDVIRRMDMMIDQAPFTVINVHLRCDMNVTPWCVQPVFTKRTKT